MEPASDRSVHPSSDASLRSTFHGRGTPAAQRTRSRGRASFSEVKSPLPGSTAAPPSSRDAVSLGGFGAGGWRMNNGGGRAEQREQNNFHKSNSVGITNNGDGDTKKSLEQHIADRNSRTKNKPFELDIQSFDKDQPTWASRDWCAEARKSRALLREVHEDKAQVDDFSCLWNTAAKNAERHETNTAYSGTGGNNSSKGYVGDRHGINDMGKVGGRRGSFEDRASINGGNDGSRSRGSSSHGRPANQKDDEYNRYDNISSQGSSRSQGTPLNKQESEFNQFDNRSTRGSMAGQTGRANDSSYSQYERRSTRGSSSRGRPVNEQQDDTYNQYDARSTSGMNTGKRPSGHQHSGHSDQNGRGSSSRGRPHSYQQDRGGYYNQSEPNEVDHNINKTRLTQNSGDKGRPRPNDITGSSQQQDNSRSVRNNGSNTRGRQMEDPTMLSRERSKSRGSQYRGRPEQQQPPLQQNQQRPSRSQSRGPSKDNRPARTRTPGPLGSKSERSVRSRTPGPPGSNSERSVRSRTPGPSGSNSEHPSARSTADATSSRQRSRSVNRPTKKLGCLGGSSDMTRHRSRSRGPHQVNTSDEVRAGIASFEQEMQSQRRQSQTDRLKNIGCTSVERRSRSTTRSQSRGPHSRGKSSNGQQRVSRDPSCSRSKSRPRTGNGAAVRDKSVSREQRSQQQLHRSLSRGRKPQSERHLTSRASPDDHLHPSRSTGDFQASTNSRSSSLKKVKKNKSGKAGTVVSSHSSSTSSTPETGPLSSYSGKSSKGSLLRAPSSKRVPSMPPSTPPQLDDSASYYSRPATPNRVPSVSGGDDSSINSSGHGGKDNQQILTNMFDRKGYCVRHPNVRLRKKKVLGGWNVLIDNCPDCCVEEMGRLQRVRKKMKKKAEKKKETKSAEKKKEKKSKVSSNRVIDLEPAEAQGQHSHSGSRGSGGQAIDARGSHSGHRSKSRDRRGVHQETYGAPLFQFDIPIDEQGDVMSPQGARSVRSRKSQKSSSSKKSSKSTKTSKATRTNKSAKSTHTSKTFHDKRGKSRSKSRDPDNKTRGGGETVVSRGSVPGSSQRFIRQKNGREARLRVAKMPFTDKYKREGRYTGEINEYGQPHGQGTLRYNNGMVYEGIWEEGHSEEMDNNMGKANENGFSGNWKNNTKAARAERERRKEQEMDDLRSFISQSVRSGVTNASGSQQGSQYNNNTHGNNNRQSPSSSQHGQQQQGQSPPGEVHNMPWEDVNGFSGYYTGEVNSQNVPDGRGVMQYSNGVVEQGMFCNGVFQPPAHPMPPQPSFADNGMGENAGAVPSSSMSVWSLRSTPTMAFAQGGHSVLTGLHPGRVGGSASSVMGAPTSVHLGGPGLYGNLDHH